MASDVQIHKQRLSRERLVTACVRIADAEGPDALTLRRVGAELGVDATAVYRHFRDKDEMLVAVADRLLQEAIDGFEPSGRWREDLRALCLRVRGVYLVHPRLAVLVAGADTPLPTEDRLSELALGILRSSGLKEEDLAPMFETVESFVLAVSNFDASTVQQTGERWRRSFSALPPERFPNLSALASRLYRDPDATFAFGLDLLLDAIELRASR